MKPQNIQDIYTLAPMQEGLLFHSIFDDQEGTGLYVDQLVLDLNFQEPPEANDLVDCFKTLLQRHSILRTAFSFERREKPLQIVFSNIPAVIQEHDLKDLSETAFETRSREILDGERSRGFNLSQPPLIRFILIQKSPFAIRLALVYHHILLDAWSAMVLFAELFEVYQAKKQNRSPRLRPAPQYQAYIAWLRSQDLAVASTFWEKQLQGFQAPTELGLVGPEKKQVALTFGAIRHQLSLEETQALTTFCKARKFPAATLAMAAWGLLLARYSGDADILFGLSVSGRPADLPEIEATLGLFINTLPLRLRCHASRTVPDYLRHVESQMATIRAYEHTPLSLIRKASNFAPGVDLFRSVVAFENIPKAAIDTVSALGLQIGQSEYLFKTNYPVNVEILPGNQWSLRICYSQEFATADAIEQMMAHWVQLLKEMVARPQATLAELSMLTPQERYRLIEAPNLTHKDSDPPHLIHQLFERHAREKPLASAVEAPDWHLSYQTLNRAANRLARHLQKLDVHRDTRIGICAERSPEMIIGILGILKAGCAYVPLDPKYPQQRLEYMVSDSQVPFILCQEHLQPIFQTSPTRCIGLEPFAQVANLTQDDDQNPNLPIHPLNLSYVIYTSGSTGNPKGVLLNHLGLSNMIKDWNQRVFSVDANSRLLLFASFSFDASVWELFSALSAGACLCSISRQTLYDGEEILAMLAKQAITHALLPPSLLSVLSSEELPKLKHLAAIGEKCTGAIVQTWVKGRAMVNAYGPAEGTITNITYAIDPTKRYPQGPPIGKPMMNITAYVFGPHLELLPAGVPGELYIGGLGLARCYLHQPRMTATKFIPDQLSKSPGGRLYKTGDRARYQSDGTIEILGRMDFQFKIRGYRVEPGEVEAALDQHQQIRRSAVILRKREAGQDLLTAYLQPEKAPPSIAELRQFLAERLPAHAIPQAFHFLDTFPLSPNGKVNRLALPEPHNLKPTLEKIFQPPQTEVEKILCTIWEEVLGVSPVGLSDNYFELGGDSILSIQIIGKAARHQLKVSPKQLFESQTVGALAVHVKPITQPKAPQNDFLPAPLSAIQQWFFQTNSIQQAFYHQAVTLRFPTPLNQSSLVAALEETLRHHGQGACRFFEDGNRRFQQRQKEVPLYTLATVESSEVSEMTFGDYGKRFCENQLSNACLNSDPLVTLLLFKNSAGVEGMTLAQHHLITDAVSWQIFLEDLAQTYEAKEKNQPVQLLPATPYTQWARAVAQWAEGFDFQEVVQPWLSYPECLDAGPSNTKKMTQSEAKLLRSTLPPSATLRFAQVPEKFPVSLEELQIAALLLAWHDVLGHSQLGLNMESHGRDLDLGLDLSRTCGWFTSLYPVLLEMPEDRELATLVHSVKERFRFFKASAKYYGPWRYLSGSSTVPDVTTHHPSISFNYLGQWDRTIPQKGFFQGVSAEMGFLRAPNQPRPYVLELDVLISQGQLIARWTHCPNVLPPNTMAILAKSWGQHLVELTDYCLSDHTIHYSPTDFPDVNLTQESLDNVLKEIG